MNLTRLPESRRTIERSISSTRARVDARRGFVLVAVLIVIMLASMVAMSLLFRVKAEQAATSASAGGDQAWSVAMSGVREAMRVAHEAEEGTAARPDDWEDNPRAFRDRLVFDDGSERWSFSVYSAAREETAVEPRFGLTDEAAKVNVNEAHQAGLEKLPHMTTQMAQALRDFVDADSTERPDGAEREYYEGLPQPYPIRNGPLDTLGELLLVRGYTTRLLYGEDANMNFRLDRNEDDGDEHPPSDDKDGRLDLGLQRYLTVCSYEMDNDADGAPRTNLNNPRIPLPGVELPPALTNYISHFRAAKGHINHVVDLLEATTKFKDASGKDVEVPSGVGPDELPQVLDLFSAVDDAEIRGRINVNTAAATVLQTIPGIDEPMAEAIVSTRRGLPPERRRTIAWLYQEKIMDAARFKQVAPLLTAHGYQYSFRVVGYGLPSGRYCVLDVIVDLARTEPSVIYLRDLTRLGLPFPVGVNTTTVTAGIRRSGSSTQVSSIRHSRGRTHSNG